jgi:hypothetical protein
MSTRPRYFDGIISSIAELTAAFCLPMPIPQKISRAKTKKKKKSQPVWLPVTKAAAPVPSRYSGDGERP